MMGEFEKSTIEPTFRSTVEPHYLAVEYKSAAKFVLKFRCLHHLLWLYPLNTILQTYVQNYGMWVV
jgi:hypothetical protein